MTTIPNYVATPTQVDANYDPDYLGPAVSASIAPSMSHPPEQQVQLPSGLASYTVSNPLHVQQVVHAHHNALQKAQTLEFQSQMDLGQVKAPPLGFSHPVDESTMNSDPLEEYAHTFLQHNALFQAKMVRGPSI